MLQGVPDLTLALLLSCCKALSSSSPSVKLSFLLLITASKLKLTMCQAPNEVDNNLMPILEKRRWRRTEIKQPAQEGSQVVSSGARAGGQAA